MTWLIRCPSCGTSLEVSAETLGRSVRCGRCASVFTASESGQGNPAPMEETDKGASDRDEAAPDRRGGRRQRRRWEDDDNDYDDSRDDRWDVRRVRRRDLVTIRSRVTPAAVFLMVYGGLLIFGGLLSLLPLGY
jgi:predicted Zn finger-like uncharacterized protein